VIAVLQALASTALGEVASRGRELADAAQQAAVSWPQRWFDSNEISGLGPLRRHRPVLAIPVLPLPVVVSRRGNVLDVLADSDAFGSPYPERLPGPFVLGLDGVELEQRRKALRGVLRAADLRDLADQAASRATECVDRARRTRSLDVGTGLVHPVLDGVVAEYLGAPGPDPATQLRWARDVFQDIFLNGVGLPAVRRRAELSAQEMSAHLGRLIAAGRAEPQQADTVLHRMLAQRPAGRPTDDRDIRYDLIGLAIGWLWHGARAALIAVDELLDRPVELALARDAARADDMARLRHVLWEVLRFRPVQIGLLRTCRRDTTLAVGPERGVRIRAGALVLAGTHSAMWDETVVPDPHRFDPTRADEQYLIFGAGPHRCLGEAIMGVQLPALLAPLLRDGGLRRAAGRTGRLRWDGASPDGLRVHLGA
jgi:cytochrome P450